MKIIYSNTFIFVGLILSLSLSILVFILNTISKHWKETLASVERKANEKTKELTISNSEYLARLKKAEFEIQKLSGIIEQNPTSIVITDLFGNIEYVNSKFTENTGYTLKEAKGKNPNILKTGKTDASLYQNLWNRIKSGKVWKGEFINRKKNGDEIIENTIIAPIFDQQGNIINYIAIKDEITERKRAERAQCH